MSYFKVIDVEIKGIPLNAKPLARSLYLETLHFSILKKQIFVSLGMIYLKINWCTSPMMINKFTPSVNNSFDNATLNQPIKI